MKLFKDSKREMGEFQNLNFGRLKNNNNKTDIGSGYKNKMSNLKEKCAFEEPGRVVHWVSVRC